MSKEILGHVTCPHCGNDKATVHRQAKGSKALYYRCYPDSREPCGTVQIILAGGQKWLNQHMRPLNKVEQQVAEQVAADDAIQKQRKAASKPPVKQAAKPEDTPTPKKTGGIFSNFFEDSYA